MRTITDVERKVDIERMLARLSVKDEAVIRLHFGIGCGRHTYGEVAKELGYTCRSQMGVNLVRKAMVVVRRVWKLS
jgi:DNA-directed RNA polymerase sigma subunit (sigma70/sigma32)